MDKIISKIEKIQSKALAEIEDIEDLHSLESIENKYLGRKSEFNTVLRGIKDVDQENRAEIGQKANEIKKNIQEKFSSKRTQIKEAILKKSISSDYIDVTQPGMKPTTGSLHPITQMIEKAESIFERMGFEVYTPYEIDDDYHNFESLNLPPGHPARDAWDTFWTEDGNVLVTHTSSMQNRIIKSSEPPIRAIVPGKCFRNEATDARHEHTFYQIEGIYVDKGIKLTDMLGTLQAFFNAFFEKEVKVKFMPDFFPFVEPGGQMALSCVLCDMKGCRVCKGSGWLEILGCGMIHPRVLEMAGVDPNVYTGFAWGFGVERLIMLKQNVEDIRAYHSGDLRFIKQF